MIVAQNGHGPSNKVETGLTEGSIQGVILSASNMGPEQLESYCKGIKAAKSDAVILFDPQYYVNFIQEADKFGKLANYDYFGHPMNPNDLASPKVLQEATQKVLDIQLDLGLKHIVTPTIEITSFGSSSEPYALSMLYSSVEYATQKAAEVDVYGSLLISEAAFEDVEKMALFLDAVTRIKALSGFYLVVDRSGGKPYWTNPQNLAAYMYMVHTLANKEVILGYTDGAGLLGTALGAKYIGYGWWQNSGNFSHERYITRNGGRRPRPVYYSRQLMGSIFVDGELSILVQKGFADQIAKTTKYDTQLSNDPLNPTSWSDQSALFHKWLVLSQEDAELAKLNTEEERLDLLVSKLEKAKALNETLGGLLPDGFKTEHGTEKLRTMIAAIAEYRKGVL